MRSVLWVDDEAELLEPHRIVLRERGFAVETATNAADAMEILRRRPFDLVLLDEQMPGTRGLAVVRQIRALVPSLPVVMVTKSEEDETLREALGADVREYLLKPIQPRQVLAAVTRILEGPALRQQALARGFVERFRELQEDSTREASWRDWIDRYTEIVQWDIDLSRAGESGLRESLHGLLPVMRRDFAAFVATNYPAWVHDRDAGAPPLSVDVAGTFLAPILDSSRAVVFVVIDCLRLDQWKVIEPILQEWFDVETTHYFAVLPTATPYARNALFSGLFPGELVAQHPEWMVDREDESLNAHERELLELQLERLRGKTPVRYAKVTSVGESEELEKQAASAIAADGVSAFVFNFIDLLTHGRSESTILQEMARDDVALRELTEQWFRRSSALVVMKEAARRRIPVVVTSDHGSIHCHTPATVFAKRDTSLSLRFKFGESVRAERPELALLYPDEESIGLARRNNAPGNVLLAVGDTFFVYPTKLREYQQRYRGAFLHGGISPEEMILPVSLLTPRAT
ncbi:MAG TPA: response regulator [Gemmatimonadaceae bacterium]|nr:response regulator [Gemmatimonadaceae bacterium]